MPIEIRIKAVKVGNSIRMTIPQEVTSYLGIRPGDTLLVSLDDHTMKVRKAEPN